MEGGLLEEKGDGILLTHVTAKPVVFIPSVDVK